MLISDDCYGLGLDSPVQVRLRAFVTAGTIDVYLREGGRNCRIPSLAQGETFDCVLDVTDGELDVFSITPSPLAFFTYQLLAQPLLEPTNTSFDILLSSGDTMRVFRHYSHGEIAIAGLALAQLLLLTLVILLFFVYQRRTRQTPQNLTVDIHEPPKRQRFPPVRDWSRRP
jgi:hypothetical protein